MLKSETMFKVVMMASQSDEFDAEELGELRDLQAELEEKQHPENIHPLRYKAAGPKELFNK